MTEEDRSPQERIAPETVQVAHEPGDPAVPNAPAFDRVPSQPASVPEDRRADVADISPPPGSSTSQLDAPRGGTGDVQTNAGDQFGEKPAPIPAQFAERVANPDTGVRALPRSDSQVVQPAPVIVGSHQVVLETASPQMQPQAITAPAPRFMSLDAGGLAKAARIAYGDPSRAADIFDANRDTMTSPDSTFIGQVVRIPD